ncbi:U-box domain-containing protein 33-like [Iris pallida]|uniref:RING-type E3 ubiquitin transferase n=1 Tax=Iris pallida TaxID=29817 RepID=A0AAX6HRF0_IRIPA|nr:U-box domain-containing protein 33-like [Iris pallida]KAJ6843094.1 U-box domain-containing protein 33-like [Iris pallida]
MASESEGSESSIRRQITNLMSRITLFSYTDIERATNGLSESSGTVWRWRFGKFYKGYLGNNEVHIKMLDAKLPQDVEEFVQELNDLTDLRHPNLAELVGACIEHRAVVYKFPDRNLEQCLTKSPWLLTWQIRTRIIYQICSALIFLYSNKPNPILHGHLTLDYILLDAEFNCTVLIPEGTSTSNPNPKGKFTEYIETGSRKLGDDVYSFGVMIVRLVTGSSDARTEREARGAYTGEWSMGNVDHTAGNWPFELAKELACFGSRCYIGSKSSSCTVEEILKDFWNILDVINNLTNNELLQYSAIKDSDETRKQRYRQSSESQGSGSSIRKHTFNEMSSIAWFSYMDIGRATNDLSESSNIGLWRYGSLYKGYLDNSRVHIKILDPRVVQGMDEFLEEVKVLNELRHPNLVEYVGACLEPRAVVYKYPSRNLEQCLDKSPRLLTWQIRTRIISQICSALAFLYSKKPHPIIHGNLGLTFILLDDNFNCKVLIPEGTATSNPYPRGKFTEYIEAGNRRLGSDVFSLGVTILRILTGLSAAGIERKMDDVYNGEEELMRNVDRIAGNWPLQLAKELAYFGLKCCYSSKSNRLHVEESMKDLRNFLAVINNFINKEEFLYSDHKDSKSISYGTTSEDEKSNVSSRTSSIQVFSYLEIERATNGLSESTKIGQGGYGSVYKGYLDNTEVAIKMLDARSQQGLEEFIQELEVLGQMRHPNLVKLIGACFKLRSLVYEFLSEGSLEDFLKNRPALLTWQMRTRIVYEICSALIFLHSNKPQPLVHGDLKPANILLDSNFNSKLADFGLCRFLPEGTNTVAFLQTANIKGTEWYIDPDFLEAGKLSPGCDVYSFGVTILRILTGAPPARVVMKVYRANERKKVMTIVDPTAGPWPDHVAEYLACIGLKCCEPERRNSELMREISTGLKDILAKIGA